MYKFDSFHEAFHFLINLMEGEGIRTPGPSSSNSVGSFFGSSVRSTKELLCPTIEITNPRDRLLPEGCRHLNYGFAYAHYMWALTSSSSYEQIMAYNPKGLNFLSHDGQLICGVSERIIGGEDLSPLVLVIEMLRNDPQTRRAYLPFVHLSDLQDVPNVFSCFGAIHFLQRNGKLDCITNMRAQSLIGVMPYDVILATLLHETVANELDLELGSYYHQCNNLHCYEDETFHLKSITGCQKKSVPMLALPKKNPLNCPDLLLQEEILRKEKKISNDFSDKVNSEYWSDIFKAMESSLNVDSK